MSKRKTDTTPKLLRDLARQRDGAHGRFPLFFALLGTFGVVSIFYGFTHIIERYPFLARNPIIPIGMGVFVLFLTGTLYKKLD